MMDKYGLTAKQLEYLLHKLVEAGLVTRKQLEARTSLAETGITKAFVSIQQSIDELDEEFAERAPGRRAEPNREPGESDADRYYRDALADLAEEEPRPRPQPSAKGRPRTIKASDLERDITSGMSDPDLMLKYQLVPDQLEFMLRKLVEAGRITRTQLIERTKITSTSITKAFVDVYQSLRELDEGDWTQ